MFDRGSKGYLDDKDVCNKTLGKFDDEYSAKYLHLCFRSDFLMRVKEKDKPMLSMNIGGLDKYTFNNDKPSKEVV